MIQHHDRAAAGFQHAMNLAHRGFNIRSVMQHAMRVDDVKRLISEVESLSIGHAKLTGHSRGFKILSREVYRRFSQIDAGVSRTRARKL